MKLKNICNNVAAKVLGDSGTILECMDNTRFEGLFNLGQCYRVLKQGTNMDGQATLKFIENNASSCQGYFATRFRKPL